MSKMKWRITPVGAFDIPALERWLEKLAAKGLYFSATLGFLACFDAGEPAEVRIHLEPLMSGTDTEDSELRGIYESAGWRFLGQWGGGFSVYLNDDPKAEAYTDAEALDYSLKSLIKRRLVAGVGLAIVNFMLLSLYWNALPLGLMDLRYFPYESMSDSAFFPFVLGAVGFFFVDLAYLINLALLVRYRARGAAGRQIRIGWLRVLGTLFLLPVIVNTVYIFFGREYDPYPLENSGFVTLTEIEGDDFRLSGDTMFNMDFISHHDAPLSAETWYFQQYGSFRQPGVIPNDTPCLEIRIARYLIPGFASGRAEEYTRIGWYGLGELQGVEPDCGFDEVYLSRGELGSRLVLVRGNTWIYVKYVGQKNLLDFLPSFERMAEAL